MERLTLLLGLVLLCVQQQCWGIPVGAGPKEEQFLYSYLGFLDTGSSACSHRLGRWVVTGNLTVQLLDKSLVLQLHDLKTTLYNGFREYLKDFEHYENIPDEVNILEKPFVLHSDFSLSLTPNEPVWSVNFKRGLASNFHEVIEGVNQEKSVFGHCETKTESKDGVMVKIINHNECDDVPFQHLTNVRPAPSPQGFSPIHRKTVIHVKFATGRAFPPESIHSESELTYTSMPKVPYNQHILQHSVLNLMSSSAEFVHIDTSKLTEKKDIFFEYADEITQGRHKYETDLKVLTERYLNGYESFESVFERAPLENRKNSTEDPIEVMYMALNEMPNEKDINHLKEQILSKNDDMMYKTFLSLISYVGTEQAVKVINEIISQSEFDNRKQLSGLQLLSTFPSYITEVNDELVQSLEGMLELENVKTELMRTAQILSFASVVNRGHKLKQLSEEKLLKYRTIYFDKFLASVDYKNKFTYLLGLINMAEALSTEFQISIIANTSLPANLRSLAIVGFKNTLKITEIEKLYDTFWPMVLNDEENFDVRTESLDLLLSANLTEDQFYSIVQQSKKYLKGDIHSKHLANYVVSTIESIQNKTAYREPLSNLASQVIQNKEFPVYPRAYWQTGNYRLSYSDVDANLGAYAQARLIGVPEMGTVSSAQISYNQFAWSFDTGVYSIYLKTQGCLENSFATEFYTAVSDDVGLPKLVDIVKKYNYKMKDMNVPVLIDIVIFNDDKVVFAKSINQSNDQIPDMDMENLVEEIVFNGFSLSFPVMDYTLMPSLLGTPLRISNDMQSIQQLAFPRNDFLFRSSWSFETWLESYNPILDASVSSFKYYGDENALRARVSANFKRKVFVWATKNDTFNWASDKLIGIDVDEKLIHKFCPNCDAVTEVSTNFHTHHRIQNYTYLGAKYNYTTEQHEVIRHNTDYFLTVNEVHQSNADAIPLAQSLMVPLHTYRHNYYLRTELSRTIYRSIEAKEGGVLTRVRFTENSEKLSSTVDPYADTHQNYSLTVITKDFDEPDLVEGEKLLTYWEFTYESKSTHNYTDENGKPKVKYTTNVYNVENNVNDFSEEHGGFQVCISRVELLPPASPNRFQISPPEDASALTILTQEYKTKDTNWNYCKDDFKTTLTEVYTTQEDRTNQILESSFYKQCLEESKELKYTPATNSCIAAYAAMSRYDKYSANMELQNITELNSEGLDTNPFVTYEREDEDKLKFSVFMQPFHRETMNASETHFAKTLYFPYKSRNPVAEVNMDQDIFRGLKRNCIISPQEIRTFATNHIPNTNTNKQIALVECFPDPQRLVEFQKVNNHQVDLGFTSRNHTIVANVEGGKLKVTLNGDELKDSVLNSGTNDIISIRFLDENAVYIADDYIGIYYNTEFINIKAKPMYKNMICGVCDE